jgi:NTE family protein
MCRPAALRVFPQEKISADVIMASACLPFLFRAVEIGGVPYWDGGYMGNRRSSRSSTPR